MLGITYRFFGTSGFVDTLISSNLTQLVFHCAFSFWFRLFGGSFAYIFCIILTINCCNLCSSSQSIVDFFLIGSLSLNTCSLITFLLVMAMLTSTIWTQGLATLGSTTYGYSVIFIFLSLNIFCMSLYLG